MAVFGYIDHGYIDLFGYIDRGYMAVLGYVLCAQLFRKFSKYYNLQNIAQNMSILLRSKKWGKKLMNFDNNHHFRKFVYNWAHSTSTDVDNDIDLDVGAHSTSTDVDNDIDLHVG